MSTFWSRFALAWVAAASLAAQDRAPRQVLAFYYDWYGNPDVSGRWFHWKDVNASARTIGGSTHYPVLGAYDSHDPKVVAGHCRQARAAGLTGFIVTWWRQGDFHDAAMPLLLDTAREHGLAITIYYESVPPREKPSPEGAVKDLLYVLERYGRHPAWLRVRDRPVIFVYGRAVGQIKLEGWQQAMAEINRRYSGGALFIGDQLSEKAAAVFDGIHTYNVTGRTAGMPVEEVRTWARAAYPDAVRKAGHKISCVTVIPGYDDTKLADRKPPRPTTDRHQGRTYRALWEEALAARPDWVLITSWNEW
ncbi:MAG: hypothetical protein ABFD86_13375, partial [Bryobacteraceae bacterium]